MLSFPLTSLWGWGTVIFQLSGFYCNCCGPSAPTQKGTKETVWKTQWQLGQFAPSRHPRLRQTYLQALEQVYGCPTEPSEKGWASCTCLSSKNSSPNPAEHLKFDSRLSRFCISAARRCIRAAPTPLSQPASSPPYRQLLTAPHQLVATSHGRRLPTILNWTTRLHTIHHVLHIAHYILYVRQSNRTLPPTFLIRVALDAFHTDLWQAHNEPTRPCESCRHTAPEAFVALGALRTITAAACSQSSTMTTQHVKPGEQEIFAALCTCRVCVQGCAGDCV